MKLIFTKLETSKDYIEISFDNGQTRTSHNKAELLENGLPFTEEDFSDFEQIRFRSGVKTIGSISIKYTPYPDLSNVVDSEGTISIGEKVFYDNKKITSITIPNSVISIQDDAFSECVNLASINIPNSITFIGEAAFHGCSSLTSITIPSSVATIGDYAFNYCASLETIGTKEQ